MSSILSSLKGAILGLVLAVVGIAATFTAPQPLAFATDTNAYVSPGETSPSCSNWRDDTAYFPGTTTPFNYYWSGQPRWWGDSTVHACWHNDEGGTGGQYWRAVDYGGYLDQPIYYQATIFVDSVNATRSFSWNPAGCGGVYVSQNNMYGQYAGSMHYWHVWIASGVAGTSSASAYYYPGQSVHVREIGGMNTAGADGCTSTGIHLHQAVYDITGGGGGVAYRHGNLNLYPFYFR